MTTVYREVINDFRQRNRNRKTEPIEESLDSEKKRGSNRKYTNTPVTRVEPADALVGASLVGAYREDVQRAFLACARAQKNAWQDSARRFSSENADKKNRSRAVAQMVDALAPTYAELIEGWGEAGEFPEYDATEKRLTLMRANLNRQLREARWVEHNGQTVPFVLADGG